MLARKYLKSLLPCKVYTLVRRDEQLFVWVETNSIEEALTP